MYLAKALGVIFFLTLVLLLIYVVGKKYSLHLETQRKLLHIALGGASLTFPFLFNTTSEVILFVIVALIALLSLRYIPMLRKTLGESVYGVKRSWMGGALFLVSIITLFFMSRDNYILYAGPLLVLTFSDAFSAVVGGKYGKKYYTIFGCRKSLEGTLTFFITGFIAICLLLAFATVKSPLTIFYSALTVAFFTTVAELFAGKALDNISVPAAAFVVLQYLL